MQVGNGLLNFLPLLFLLVLFNLNLITLYL